MGLEVSSITADSAGWIRTHRCGNGEYASRAAALAPSAGSRYHAARIYLEDGVPVLHNCPAARLRHPSADAIHTGAARYLLPTTRTAGQAPRTSPYPAQMVFHGRGGICPIGCTASCRDPSYTPHPHLSLRDGDPACASLNDASVVIPRTDEIRRAREERCQKNARKSHPNDKDNASQESSDGRDVPGGATDWTREERLVSAREEK
ncbi:hypothetical protein B0H16DRAFT_1597923 [Mycena metata]|uniref:Uncharacterized protein n=1 Tax=Mycena metata TaxID=1033252 RepID=A0AAD7HMN9_9AGAR|nr:hypothetical protein B0H16DRAFT_1597923 [Mycena metata]